MLSKKIRELQEKVKFLQEVILDLKELEANPPPALSEEFVLATVEDVDTAALKYNDNRPDSGQVVVVPSELGERVVVHFAGSATMSRSGEEGKKWVVYDPYSDRFFDTPEEARRDFFRNGPPEGEWAEE